MTSDEQRKTFLAILASGFAGEGLTVMAVMDRITPYLDITNAKGGQFSLYFINDDTLVVNGRYPSRFHINILDPESIPDLLARLSLPM